MQLGFQFKLLIYCFVNSPKHCTVLKLCLLFNIVVNLWKRFSSTSFINILWCVCPDYDRMSSVIFGPTQQCFCIVPMIALLGPCYNILLGVHNNIATKCDINLRVWDFSLYYNNCNIHHVIWTLHCLLMMSISLIASLIPALFCVRTYKEQIHVFE